MRKLRLALLMVAMMCCLTSCVSSELGEAWLLKSKDLYGKKVFVDGIKIITQEISCGYAVIEMFSDWVGNDIITEEQLFCENQKIVTSTGKGFAKEMNKRFPEFKTKLYKNLSAETFIDKAYDSLKENIPVPFEWAAKNGDEWTVHYSLLVGLDIPKNKVTVLNPYGYIEELSLKAFLARTSFEAYENMPFKMKMGFTFGVFEKNALFITTKKS